MNLKFDLTIKEEKLFIRILVVFIVLFFATENGQSFFLKIFPLIFP